MRRNLPTATVKDERRDIIAALTEAMKELALPADFGWGPVIEVHHIGTFTIMEYEDKFPVWKVSDASTYKVQATTQAWTKLCWVRSAPSTVTPKTSTTCCEF